MTYPTEQLLVEGDPVRLGQIVANLLRNAVQYTNPRGRIDVVVERDGKSADVRVRDDGIGIAPDALQRIFDLFVQAGHEQERAVGGLGIGLAVVRELALLHGGRVEAHSAGLGKGSEFVLHLPRFEMESQPARARPQRKSFAGRLAPSEHLPNACTTEPASTIVPLPNLRSCVC